jgi:hypothetical protein
LRNSFDQQPHYLQELDEAEALEITLRGKKMLRTVDKSRSLIETKTSGRRDLLSARRHSTLIDQRKGET